MTTTAPGWAEPTTPLDVGGPPDPPTPAPASERGHTDIGPSVVSKIAARAALGVPGVLRSEPSGLSRVLNVRASGVPDASATITEGRAHVELKVTMAYPAPVWSTAEQVRVAVRADVERFTGLGVGEVDLDVSLARRVVKSRRVV